MKKVLRWIERIAHSIGFLLAIVAIVAVGVIIARPPQKSGNPPNFAGVEQQQKTMGNNGTFEESGARQAIDLAPWAALQKFASGSAQLFSARTMSTKELD